MPDVIIALSIFDSCGTYFPSIYMNINDVYARWNQTTSNALIGIYANASRHSEQFLTQKALENFYNKESENIYVLPFFFVTNPVKSAAFIIACSDVFNNNTEIPYGWGALYHLNPYAHSECAYQLYSWIKWTLTE